MCIRDSYNVGEQVSFTVKVSNLGVEPLTNLEVADVMPNITLDAASLNNNIKQVSSQSGTAVMIQTLQPGETVTLDFLYTVQAVSYTHLDVYKRQSGTTSYNGKTYYSLSNTVKPSTGDGINLTFKVLKEESDSAGGEDADYLGDNRLANRSWVSFHTIETRLDADKEGGGDKLTSATSEAVSTFYDNLPEPVMDTYKTFENGNADLQDRQGFVKKIYPGDWVDSVSYTHLQCI